MAKRELFGDDADRPELAAYQEGVWHWDTRPVLRLDMSGLQDTGSGIGPALADLVYVAARLMNIQEQFYFQRDKPVISLVDLIRTVTARWDSRIVILVDEYDAPILEHMHQPRSAVIRQQLADFYGVFKREGEQIEKLVMTGVTRFAKTGLWSRLNQVQDWTDSLKFHDLVGFTDAELDALWDRVEDQIPVTACQQGEFSLSRHGWQEWYNGYRFAPAATEPIYNPYAIVCSLLRGRLGEYWPDSGHMGVVESLLQEPWMKTKSRHSIPLYLTRPPSVHAYALNFDWLDPLVPGQTPEQMLLQWSPEQLVPLLYQTGYLTLTAEEQLAPPNREIATYLSHVLLKPWLEPDGVKRALVLQGQLVASLQSLDVPGLVASFNSLLHLLPHQRFRGEFPGACNLVLDLTVLLSRGHIRYHQMERSGLLGDADTTLGWDDVYMVIEFKSGTRESARSGQRQIERKAYIRALPEISRLYLGLALHTDGRQVAAWNCQGYSPQGVPLGKPLTDQDAWPATREELYQRWAVRNTGVADES